MLLREVEAVVATGTLHLGDQALPARQARTRRTRARRSPGSSSSGPDPSPASAKLSALWLRVRGDRGRDGRVILKAVRHLKAIRRLHSAASQLGWPGVLS